MKINFNVLNKFLLFFSSFSFIPRSHAQDKFISFKDNHLSYEGRIVTTPDAFLFSWPGTSVKINFKGTELKAILKDTDSADYFNVIIDENIFSKIHPDTVKNSYALAKDLPFGNHTVELYKRTESDKGNCLFYGFLIDPQSIILKPLSHSNRRMEFYGNSITCGYGDEDPEGNNHDGFFENNFITYAALTAHHYNAHFNCVAKSGIGLTVSWFPLIMPEMYDRQMESNSDLKWNFKRNVPQIVVVDLFQNDSWIVNLPGNIQFKKRFNGVKPSDSYFIKQYGSFISQLRSKYPKAHIICTLGNMDASKEGSIWRNYISQAVTALKDKKLYVHFFDYKNTPGHPKIAEQADMAASLIRFIDDKHLW